jgi:hypothetical protein
VPAGSQGAIIVVERSAIVANAACKTIERQL